MLTRRPGSGGARVLAVLVAGTTILATASAAGQSRPRAVVLPFEGWGAEPARRAAARGLENDYELVEESAVVDAASRIGVDPSTPRGMAAVVTELRVTLVVGGFVSGRGPRASTTVWAMDVRGNELTRRTLGAPTGRRGAAAIAEAAATVAAEGMAVLSRAGAGPIAIAEEPEPEPVMVEEAESPPPEAPAIDVSGRWNQPFVRALAGLRIRNRSAAVEPDEAQNRFDSDFFPDVQIAVEARPFARAAGAERGLYLAASGGFSAGISYVRRDGAERAMQVYGFEVDAGYALTIAELVEIVLAAGFGIDGIDLVDAQSGGPEPDFPSTAYTYLRPAAQARVRIVPDHILVAEAGLGGRFVVDSGAIQRLGPEGTTTSGLDLFAGLAGILEPGVSWAARFGYQNYWLSFRDLPAYESGTDECVQVWLMIGWSF